MEDLKKEKVLTGFPICRGIAIGFLHFLDQEEISILETEISSQNIEQEIKRYRAAMAKSIETIQTLKDQLLLENSTEGVLILESQLEILKDPLLNENIEEKISKEQKNAEFVLQQTFEKLQLKFKSIANPFFSERYQDLQEIFEKLLCHLSQADALSLIPYSSKTIICAKNLNTAEIASADATFISGFITEEVGPTSHAAIIAKSKGIPFITNIDLSLLKDSLYQELVLDSCLGKIILNPLDQTLDFYKHFKQKIHLQIGDFQEKLKWPAETFDGFSIRLSANLEVPEEVDLIHKFHADGVGLFRSEYLLFAKDAILNEEEQFHIYRQLAEKMKGLPVAIRTFDFSSDKMCSLNIRNFENFPFSNSASRRSFLNYTSLFKTQLRAILRASIFGNVHILLPMISSLEDLLLGKKILDQVKNEIGYSQNILLGCMIETPSAALNIAHIVKECDFLSIGTNDLVHYVFTADRSSYSSQDFYHHADPSFIRLIKLITHHANEAQIPAYICGEMAADPRFTPLLLGLGIRGLSVSPYYLPSIKNAIRSLSIVESIEITERALYLKTGKEVLDLLNEEYQKNVPHDLFYNSKEVL